MKMSDFKNNPELSLKLCPNPKVIALETTLEQTFTRFKDLVLEFEKMCIESRSYKNQILELKEKCDNKSCASSEAFKQIIKLKDNIIQSIATMLIELNETKNFSIISEAFRIISGEPLTPPVSIDAISSCKMESSNNHEADDNVSTDLSNKDGSGSDIDDTTSGRKSPIIQTKKARNFCASVNNAKVQEKKKCSETWPTPEKKTVKLSFPTPTRGKPNGKLRQSRLNLVKVKSTTVVDLTSSPEAVGAFRSFQYDSSLQTIKKEAIENDDTILPSPTSGPINFPLVYKTISKDSPGKLRKTLSKLKLKCVNENNNGVNNENNISVGEEVDVTEMEESVNILKQTNRSKNSPSKCKKPLSISKLKTECTTFVDDNDENINREMEESLDILEHLPGSVAKQGPCTPVKSKEPNSEDINESMSLLQRIKKYDDKSREIKNYPSSPSKRPLSENNNLPSQCGKDLSMSVLETNLQSKETKINKKIKRAKADLIEPVFKEPTVRKKSEKRALPGWSCDECKQFYDELYKDNPEMLRRKMEECSRHRGRTDPARPRTPPGFWCPRWHVPNDTDEFNRLNDAL